VLGGGRRGWVRGKEGQRRESGMFVHGKIRCVFLLLHVNASCFVNCIAWAIETQGRGHRAICNQWFFSALPFSVDPHRVSADPDPPSFNA